MPTPCTTLSIFHRILSIAARFCCNRLGLAQRLAAITVCAIPLLVAGCTQRTTQATPLGNTPKTAPARVEVSKVEAGEVTPQLNLVGTVVAARRSVVGSAVDGRVTRINFEAGDAVADPGEPIAELLTDTISIEIASAVAQLELRKQQLAELEAGTREEEIRQAKARWEAAKASSAYAQARFERLDVLYQQAGSVSREEFEEARSSARSTAQQLAAAHAAYDLAVAGPRPEQIEQARANVAQQQEEVNRLEDTRDQHTILAPFSGYILAKHTEVGAWLSRGDPVVEIAELDPVDIEVQVPESLVSGLQLGDRLPIAIDALPVGENQYVGTVDRIVPGADLRARTFPVMVRLSNLDTGEGYRIKDGMLARVTIAGRTTKAMFVPKEALIAGDDAPALLVLEDRPDGPTVARRIYVRSGIEKDSRVEVRGELQLGDRVVTGGHDRVRPGQAVEVK